MYDIVVVNRGEPQWAELKQCFPMARRIDPLPGSLHTIRRAAELAKTKYFFLVDDLDATDFDFTFEVPTGEPEMSYYWGAIDTPTGEFYPYRGVKLFPRKPFLSYDERGGEHFDYLTYEGIEDIKRVTPWVKEMPERTCRFDMLADIVFISYDEEHADANYASLLDRFPRARRVHGVKGIHEAHLRAAEICTSRYFYVIDADCHLDLDTDFDFTWLPSMNDPPTTHVWFSRNPVHCRAYGYGGVKLFHRQDVIDRASTNTSVDFTRGASEHFCIHPEIISTTRFDWSPWSCWRAGFREAVKLSMRLRENPFDGVTQHRLASWLNDGEPHGQHSYVRDGAEHGVKYAKANSDISLINDYDWLFNQFAAYEYDTF